MLTAVLAAPTAFGGELPFVYEKANGFAKGTAADVIYEDEGFVLRRNPLARSLDFQDLYVVDLKDHPVALNLAKFGTVLESADGSHAVLRMTADSAAELSSALHTVSTHEEQGLGCGKIFRLFGDTVRAPLEGASGPVHGVSKKIPAIETAIADVNDAVIKETVESLSARPNRKHRDPSAKDVASTLIARYKVIGAARQDLQTEEVTHSSTPQNSLIVRLVGKTKPNEIIVLGSHIDSISWIGNAPGADDNASGTGTNLEIFRVIVENNLHFDRTIEFHGYAGEEGGLLGSQEIAKSYRDASKNVVAMVQHDMNIFTKDGVDKIWLVSNDTNAALNDDLAALNDSYVGAPWEKAVLTAGSSDHAAWDRQGYVAAFPFENPRAYNRNIHTRKDTIENSGVFSMAVAFAKLGVAYVGHYAGLVQN
jgi:bacterial leucyl aminopeptidase